MENELTQLKIELFMARLKIIILKRRNNYLEDKIDAIGIHLAKPFMFPGIRFEVDPDGTDTRFHRTPESDQAGFAP